MKIGELRIGNWFIGYDGKPFQFRYEHFAVLCPDGLSAYDVSGKVELDEMVKGGVPLTEELLRKCPDLRAGKNSDGQVSFYVMKSRFEVKWTIEHWEETEYNEECYFVYGIGKLHYLHELQNVFFIKERKELNIEL